MCGTWALRRTQPAAPKKPGRSAQLRPGTDAHSPKFWPEAFVKYINTFGQDKVIFGTDFPILDFKRARDEVENLGLRPVPKEKLLRANAMRIYGLSA